MEYEFPYETRMNSLSMFWRQISSCYLRHNKESKSSLFHEHADNISLQIKQITKCSESSARQPNHPVVSDDDQRESADFNSSFRDRYSSNLQSRNLSIRAYAILSVDNFKDREYRLIISPNTVYTHKRDRHYKLEMSSDTKMDDNAIPTTEVNSAKMADSNDGMDIDSLSECESI